MPARTLNPRTQLVVGVTDNVNSYNPIADSAAFMASVWCQVYGCLITYDYEAAAYKGMLVERWEVADPTTWVFHLRRDLKSHDGHPLTADDVVFSIDRMKNDKQSAKRGQVAPIKSVEAIDQHTVRMVTNGPTADLLEYLTDHVLVMQKRLDRSPWRPRGRPQPSLRFRTLPAQGIGDWQPRRSGEESGMAGLSCRTPRTS